MRQGGQHGGADLVGLSQPLALFGLPGHPFPVDGQHRLGGEHLDQAQVGRWQRPPVQGQHPPGFRWTGRDRDVGGVRVDRAVRSAAATSGPALETDPVRAGMRRVGGGAGVQHGPHAEPDPGLLQHGVHGVGGIEHAGGRGGHQLGLGPAAGGLPGAEGAAVDHGRDGDPDDDENQQGEGVLGLCDGERAERRGVEVVGQQPGDHRCHRRGQDAADEGVAEHAEQEDQQHGAQAQAAPPGQQRGGQHARATGPRRPRHQTLPGPASGPGSRRRASARPAGG